MTTCDAIQHDLSDFADGLLPPDRRAEVLAHVRGCTDCSGVLADLERVAAAARELGPMAPPDHIWLEVAGQLRIDGTAPAERVAAPAARVGWQWIGLAAALVIITAVVYEVGRERAAPRPAPATAAIQTVGDDLAMTMTRYQQAIGALESAAKTGDGDLDPAVARTLRVNLASIDAAIAESRAALVETPSSEPARDSLFDALRRKVSVLQMTVALVQDAPHQ